MWNFRPFDFDTIDEIEKGPDRVTAIVAAALVESNISDVISRRLKHEDSEYERKRRKELLHVDGPLGAVGSKARLAFLLGMLSEDAHQDISNLAEIRNQFAHKTETKSFNSQRITARCSNFRLIKDKRRVYESAGLGHNKDGTIEKFETTCLAISASGERFISISVLDHEKKLRDPKWQYILTSKLLLAALDIHVRDSTDFII
jgi:Mannitol repressor